LARIFEDHKNIHDIVLKPFGSQKK